METSPSTTASTTSPAPAPVKPKRTRVAWWLFIMGVISGLLGLLGHSAEVVPAIQKIISPQYVLCKEGLTTLQKTRKLERDQPGCRELANLVLTKLKEAKPEVDLGRFGPIEDFTVEQSVGTSFSAQGAPQVNVVPVTARFKKGDVTPIPMTLLQGFVDGLKSESKAQYSVLLSLLGLILLIAGFLTKK